MLHPLCDYNESHAAAPNSNTFLTIMKTRNKNIRRVKRTWIEKAEKDSYCDRDG